jgi:HSP20 family protein
MENFLRHGGFEMPDPVRRFLQGEAESGLRIEQYSDGNTLVIRTDVPGIDPEKDVDLTVTDDVLTIEARREEPAHKTEPSYRSEVRYGTTARSVPLPRSADHDSIQATYVDGVLEIRVQLPDQPGAASTKVRVSRGGHQSPDAPENYVT